METKVAFMVLFCVGMVLPYPTGVPNTPEVCQNMTPGHGAAKQNSKAPYSVEAAPGRVSQGDVVQVVLTGSIPFKGFYVQARTPQGVPIGTFTPTSTIKVHSCGEAYKNNAAFHSGNQPKQSVEVFWKAPRDYAGQIIFTSSFVSEFEQFWTHVKASPITVKA